MKNTQYALHMAGAYTLVLRTKFAMPPPLKARIGIEQQPGKAFSGDGIVNLGRKLARVSKRLQARAICIHWCISFYFYSNTQILNALIEISDSIIYINL